MKAVFCIVLSLLVNAYGRGGTDLGGKWHYIIDPFDVGLGKGLMMDAVPADKHSFFEYSYTGGKTLMVPGDWNHQDPELRWYEGVLWEARHFAASPSRGKRQILYFAGVSLRCDVFLNGVKVVSHEGAFTPFEADVTELIREGDNFLAVRVDNTRHPDSIPALSFDWWNYGGITRDVFLIEGPEVHVRDYFIRLQKGEKDRIVADVQLSVPDEGLQVGIEIPRLGFMKTLRTDKNGHARGSWKVRGLERWAPLAPMLYEVTLFCGEDRISDKIGFRDVAVDGTAVSVNGTPAFLKCISFHEEIPWESRRACSPEDASVLIDAALELGCNAIRLAHYPQNEHIVRLAEEKGLLIWEEIPLWQGIDFSSRETFRRAATYLEEMVGRDRNRCAIILWSISNETRPSPDRNAFLLDLLEEGRALDASRLFTSAFDGVHYDSDAAAFRIEDDPFAASLDVVGINKYMGWYAKWPGDPSSLQWEVLPDKPLVISEFGCEAKAGIFGQADVAWSWSEDYQVSLYRDNLEMFRHIENLAGVSPWILFDFRSPFRQHPVHQDYYNRKGLLSDRGEKKKAWYVMNEFYREK